jgi:class 3 adenylate cyclase
VICFTDLAGSTELMRSLGDERARELLRRHEQLTRRCLWEHSGREVQHTGDGFLLAFPSAGRCIDFAVALQRAIGRLNQEASDPPLELRIGIHAGETIAEADRLFGAAVNAAARLCALARPGEIVVSDLVRGLATGRSLPVERSESRTLKGFSEPFLLHWIDWSG